MSFKYLLVFSLAVVALTTPSLADYHKPPTPHGYKPPIPIGKPPKGGVKPPPEHKPPTTIGLPPKGEIPLPEYNPPKPIGKPKGEKPLPIPVGKPPKGEKPLPEHKLPTPVGIPPKGEKPLPEHKPPKHGHYPGHPSVANTEDLHKPPRKVMPPTPSKKPLSLLTSRPTNLQRLPISTECPRTSHGYYLYRWALPKLGQIPSLDCSSIASSTGFLYRSLVEMQWSAVILRHIRGQNVTYKPRSPLTASILGSRRRLHDRLATSHALGAWLVLCLWLAALTSLSFADARKLSDLTTDSTSLEEKHNCSMEPKPHKPPKAPTPLAPAPTPTSPDAPSPSDPPKQPKKAPTPPKWPAKGPTPPLPNVPPTPLDADMDEEEMPELEHKHNHKHKHKHKHHHPKAPKSPTEPPPGPTPPSPPMTQMTPTPPAPHAPTPPAPVELTPPTPLSPTPLSPPA
ncbi:hypothetical protein Acr_24g0004500 [Actinidia rufa]|uniref:Proline-rich extensin-like family protein n=1 Tax=Actinidia rufa TaxID=165716 RepID=A0A7J0GTU6_9ERIC|nr:hypothetical protein Acr_24g0004500 [Actinidia rufa]